MALNNNNNFLQSDIWRKFQEAVGCRTFYLELKSPSNPPFEKREGLGFSASIIEHQLPVVGKYFYCPRGPVIKIGVKSEFDSDSESNSERLGMTNIIALAKKEKSGWIRIDPENDQVLELIKNNVSLPIKKAPHDMQPREILVMDIAKSEEELLTDMKSKTRYNIKLAEKKGVKISSSWNMEHATWNKKYINEFIRLIKLTEKRKGIKFHSANYYQKMLEVIPGDILKLYVAEYNDNIIAANLIVFYGNTATYLHGATDDEYRNVMAPYLLQWQAIKDAKKAGYKFYDFGGVCSGPTASGHFGRERSNRYNAWSGITKFKTGFAPTTEPVIFPGSYDIIIDRKKYYLYRVIQKIKCWIG